MIEIPVIIQILLFPVIILVLWTLLFNSKSSRFTKFVVEGGYLVLVIPLMVLTFVLIPFMTVAFWLNTTESSKQIVQLFVFITIGIILIVEYYYIKRIVKQIEEKEQMTIWQVFKRELDPDVRNSRKKKLVERSEESQSYLDAIEKMNEEKRKMDMDKKERLKRALLNESD
ncbi:MAG: hypothetical protein GPJ54_13920 [Candidatus Heimdallarchaeota archaeon]|nr:hypothetical protein [Candidatus Heimdallarchaeota archaeon]